MFPSIVSSLVVVLMMLALPPMAASMVTVRATRQYNETDPNCTAYIDEVREWINDELVAMGYNNSGSDRLLLSSAPIQTYTVVQPLTTAQKSTAAYKKATAYSTRKVDCERVCFQFPTKGYCWSFTEGECGFRPNRRLGERRLVTDEEHEQCLARQHLLLDGFISAAMNLNMTYECREFFLSPWETRCFFGGDVGY